MPKQKRDAYNFHREKKSDGIQSGHNGLQNNCFFVNIAGKAYFISHLVFLLAILLTVLGMLFIVLAKTERGLVDPYNRTIGLRKILNSVVKTARIANIRICACQPNRVDHVVLHNGFKTTVSIYDPGGSDLHPGIVLIHGNVWNGQRLSTYRVVAHSLAEEGFIVLTFDKVGFGESDDPFGQGPTAVASAFDTVTQVEKAVEYFIEHTDVDPNNITLLGHSGGVTDALELGQKDERIANVVIWVAPFAPDDKSEVDANLAYLDRKFQTRYELLYHRRIPDWFKWDLTGIEEENSDDIWEYYRQQDHKPLILVLGENDNPDDHPDVLKTYETLAEPKNLVVIRRADHYLNTAQSLRWVFYDQDIVNGLVKDLVTSLYK